MSKSKFVLSEQQAVKELEAIAEFWEVEDEEIDSRLINAARRGRIKFDEENGSITYTLKFPVAKLDDTQLTEVTMNQVSAEVMRSATGSEELKGVKVIASSCGLPLGVFERIKTKDFILIGAIFGFFS